MKILSADHVLPISAEPIKSGAVAIDGQLIAAVGTRAEMIAKYPHAAHTDLGEAAILPGFVNCHSHLELTAMRGFLDKVEHDFRSWLLTLNKTRSEILSDDDIRAAAVSGAVEGARAGVTCFGDIGRHGEAGFAALKAVGLRGISFQETEFAPDNRIADQAFERLRELFLSLREQGGGLVEAGISPHAPYTVSRRLFEKITEYALEENVRVSIHAAESPEEDQLMKTAAGFFMDIYEKFGFEWESPRCSSIEFLSETGILQARPLLAHCVTASDSDIELIAKSGAGIAHCPKSNAKFGHGTAPFEKFLAAGAAVGLGSDSVASNNLCDMLEEARFASLTARMRPGRTGILSAKEALEAATIGGARAMLLDGKIGTLEADKHADIAVVSLTNAAQQPVTDIYAALVFSSCARDVIMTLVDGETVFRDGVCVNVDERELVKRMSAVSAKLV